MNTGLQAAVGFNEGLQTEASRTKPNLYMISPTAAWLQAGWSSERQEELQRAGTHILEPGCAGG